MKLFIFLIVGFSITNAIVFLHVFGWLRRLIAGISDAEFNEKAGQGTLKGFRRAFLGRLLHCHACLGFWVGSFLSISFGGFIQEYVEVGSLPIVVLLDGFLLSGSNFILWVFLWRHGAEEL